MQPKDEIYCITDEMGRCAVNNNGTVDFVSTVTPLAVSPDGWQEKSIKYARNMANFAMWRNFTNPLKYVKDAAFIVRDQLYRYGTERKLYQLIHRLDKSFGGGWVHRFFYKGELDLSQAQDDDTSVTVNIMEGDLIKLFKANENTPYEIDIDVPEAVNVKMDGLDLKRKQSWLTSKVTNTVGFSTVPLFEYTTDGQPLGIVVQNVVWDDLVGFNPASSDRWFLQAVTPLTFNVTGKFQITISVFFGDVVFSSYRVYIETSLGNSYDIVPAQSVSTVGLPVSTENPSLRVKTFDINTTFSLAADEKAFMIIACGENDTHQIDETQLDFNYFYKYKTTYIKALRPAYVAQKLLDKITGSGYTFTSNYLTTEWENLLISSGDAVRKLDNPKLKISWSDFYEAYNVPCNLCAGIRNQILYIEQKADAFQPTIQQAMGEVKGLVISTAKDFQYNVVKIGYPNTDTQDVNGKDEFNVTQVYTSPITRVNKSLDLISKVIASMYEIEITRINLDGKTTTDDTNDNRSFFLHVEKTATAGTGDEPVTYYKLLRNTYTSITGLISPSTAFNLELHPELCLKRHGNFLRGVFYWQEAGNLVYQTSDKNGDVVVMNGGQTYIGNKTIQIGSFAAPLFIPLTFKYESPMPNDTIETMDAGPDGTFSLQYDGETLYGFPMDVSIQPSNRPAQETTLLCSPQTDILKLITISR